VLGGRVALREEAGRLDDDLDPHLGPGQIGRVALREHAHLAAVHNQSVVGGLNLAAEAAVDSVVAQQMGRHGRIHQIVDGHDLEPLPALASGSEDVPADAPEPVDGHAYAHAEPLRRLLDGEY